MEQNADSAMLEHRSDMSHLLKMTPVDSCRWTPVGVSSVLSCL